MSITGNTMSERLPFLLERAAELGVPVEVRPQITRTESGDVVATTVTVHAYVGETAPNVDVQGLREADALDGQWLRVVGEQDLETAASLRRHQVVEGVAESLLRTRPPMRTYTHGRGLAAAAKLLQSAEHAAELQGVVRVTRDPDPTGTVVMIAVNWGRITDPGNPHGAVTIALIAKSLLDGDVVDVSGLTHVDRGYADTVAEALALIDRRRSP